MPRLVAVAYSGGRDSSALLHATQRAAAPLGVEVLALHVHHGLGRHADAWEAHCRAQCAAASITFLGERLTTRPARGDSIEAWARRARYQALRRLALEGGANLVLLAHHRRDQAETLLLQALRGAGIAGLAGMPRQVLRDGIHWARPWLDMPREQIDAYIAAHAVEHIDDDSNADPRFARNRLRLSDWPALTAAFPQVDAALATAAQWAQQAGACLDELAALDLGALDAASPSGAAGLPLCEWQSLSSARRSNALRAWLRRATGQGASAALVERLLRELPAAGEGHWPCGNAQLRRHRGQLRLVPMPARAVLAARKATLAIRRAGRYRLPGWGGSLCVERVAAGGVALAWLARVELKARAGGERFQAAIGRPARSLKKQFQGADVPAWQRDGPLVYSGGQLVFVPGLGLDARVIALPGQPQVRLHWLPAGATDGTG